MQRWQLSKLIEAIELFVIVQNIIMIVLVGWKLLCCFTLSSVFSMWESKFLCGYECHFLDVVGGGCAKWDVCENSLWKQSSTTIYRRHCCLQTLFLLFKCKRSMTQHHFCYKIQCALIHCTHWMCLRKLAPLFVYFQTRSQDLFV